MEQNNQTTLAQVVQGIRTVRDIALASRAVVKRWVEEHADEINRLRELLVAVDERCRTMAANFSTLNKVHPWMMLPPRLHRAHYDVEPEPPTTEEPTQPSRTIGFKKDT